MENINVTRDCEFIKVLAAQARNERVDSDKAIEAADICKELCSDLNPQNRHMIAQTIAWGVDELRRTGNNVLDLIADRKVIGYNEQPIFMVPQGAVQVYEQAFGATPPRSMVGMKTFTMSTKEIAARPAMSLMDARQGRIDFAELIREAAEEFDAKITEMAITALVGATGVRSAVGQSLANLRAVANPLRRYGTVMAVGDIGTLSKWGGVSAFTNIQAFGDSAQQELLKNGYLGTIDGITFLPLDVGNHYVYNNGVYTEELYGDTATNNFDTTTFLIPAGMNANQRNLKICERGGIEAFEQQLLDDMVFEVRLDMQVGVAVFVGQHGMTNYGIITE